MSKVFDNSLELKVSVTVYVTVSVCHDVLNQMLNVDPCDMLNSFCFHAVTCHMSNAYVDPWDMLNNFCFHV